MRDGDWGGGGRGQESEGSTADTARKRPERPWTATRTMEVLRRCPLTIAQRLVHYAIAVSTAVLGRVTVTMSVALLLRKVCYNRVELNFELQKDIAATMRCPISFEFLTSRELHCG